MMHGTNLLSTASKIGPSKKVRAFNLPLEQTCCAPGSGIATDCCRAVCYAYKMSADRPRVYEFALKNYAESQLPGFVGRMIHQIKTSNVVDFKVHVTGDYFSTEYIQKWVQIVRECSPVTFLSYTRGWRDNRFVPALTSLAALPNMRLLLSVDHQTGVPPDIPNTRSAWMACDDADHPAVKAHVAFRATVERTADRPPNRRYLPLKVMGLTPVCPHQSGAVNPPTDCVTCRICM